MQKIVYLFTRKLGLSRAEFFAHYLSVHAKLAVKHNRALQGYVVNLTDVLEADPAAPAVNRIGAFQVDAITVNWRTQLEHAFDSPEGQAALVADHDSFLGARHAFIVAERVRKAGEDLAPGTRSAGVKLIVFELDGKHAEHPAALVDDDAVLAWTENEVLSEEGAASPFVASFVEARVRSAEDAGMLLRRLEAGREGKGAGQGSGQRAVCVVSEYVQIPRPRGA